MIYCGAYDITTHELKVQSEHETLEAAHDWCIKMQGKGYNTIMYGNRVVPKMYPYAVRESRV